MGIQITDNSDKFIAAKNAAVDKALEMIGLKAEAYAKMACPVDTGRLRNSITHQKEGAETEVIGTNVEYAAYVEMGTSRMSARPYLKPAAADHGTEYRDMIEDCLRHA